MTLSPRRPLAGLTRRGVPVLGLLLAVALVGLLLYGVLAKAPDTTIDDALSKGESVPSPGFALDVLLAGEPGPLSEIWARAARDGQISLHELQGTPVVINFWASWCEPCRVEAPILESGWRTARSRGVLFVGINMQDIRTSARDFAKQYGLGFPSVRDPSDDTSRRWGATGIPETFFISRDGNVVAHVRGTVTAQQLADGVDAALAGRPRAAAAGGDRRSPR